MSREHVPAVTTLTYKRRVNNQVEKLNPNRVKSEREHCHLKESG